MLAIERRLLRFNQPRLHKSRFNGISALSKDLKVKEIDVPVKVGMGQIPVFGERAFVIVIVQTTLVFFKSNVEGATGLTYIKVTTNLPQDISCARWLSSVTA